MAYLPTGSFSRSGGIMSAIAKNLRLLNLKPVKRITLSFDPFHESVKATRDFSFHMSGPKIIRTNPKCIFRTNILSDRSAPIVVVELIPEVHEAAGYSTVKFDATNLTSLELLQLFNKHITPFAPKEEVVNVVKTKSAKKSRK